MALNSTALTAAAQVSIYNKLKALQSSKIPDDASADQKADVDKSWQDMASAIAACMTDVIQEFLTDAVIQVTIPTGIVIVGVTGGAGAPSVGIPNAAPIALTGIIQS